MGRNQHLYFLVHNSHERFKVGLSACPLLRWAQIQPHAQTDFTASLVFDLSTDVRAKWVEETLHRALSKSRYAMASGLDGYTEWFNYSAFATAHAFAREYRELLGISDGYAISLPQKHYTGPSKSSGHALRSPAAGGPPANDSADNEAVAAIVEALVTRMIDSGALLGSAMSVNRVDLYLRRDRISPDEVSLHPNGQLVSGPRVLYIFGGMVANDAFIRLAIPSPFYESRKPDGLVTADGALLPSERWVLTAPGFERVRAAVSRLVAHAGPLPAGHPAAALSRSLLLGA